MISRLSKSIKISQNFRLLSSKNVSEPINIPSIRKDLTNLLSNQYDFTLPKQEPRLVPMNESFSIGTIPLTCKQHYLSYKNPYGGVRLGKLLEDLDTMAVHISYKHNNSFKDASNNSHPLQIVTAFVDDIKLHVPQIPFSNNMTIQGQVSWVGSSSMEILMHIFQESQDQRIKILDATFLMVARDPKTGKAAQVNGLKVDSMEERKIFSDAELRKRERILKKDADILKTVPTLNESCEIHKSFLNTLDKQHATFSSRIKTENSIWMENAKLKSCILAMPVHQNIHGKLFGGYIMRKAYELAYANVTTISGTSCISKHIDDITFSNPVEIGSIFLLNSQVVYTENDAAVCRVYATVHNPIKNVTKTTNTFNFQFETFDNSKMPKIIPKSYGESLLYIDGKRRLNV